MRRVVAVLTFFVATFVLSTGVAGASVGSAKSDDAGTLGGCLGNICGSVMNESNHIVWAIKDWGDPSSEWDQLLPGEETPRDQDWDGFSVQCNASGRIARWAFPGYWVWRDFNVPAGWVQQIYTDEDAHVRSQSC